MTVDLRQFECFIAVAEEANVGRAAARLHMTQPPLTRRIARLEAEIGARLFDRTPSGVELTRAGEVLLDRAYQIVRVASHAVNVTHSAHAGAAGALVVGYFGSMVFGVLPRLLHGFLHERSLVNLFLERVSTDGQAEAIRNGRMHLGFSRHFPDEPGLSVHPIPGEPLCAAVPIGHRLASSLTLTLADLAEEPIVLFPTLPRPSFAEEIARLFERSGMSPRVAREAEDVVTALAYVASAGLSTVVLESAANIAVPGVSFVPVVDVPPQPMNCLYRRYPSPLVSSFLDYVARLPERTGLHLSGPRPAAIPNEIWTGD